MPAKPLWHVRIPEILSALRALDTPLLDRATVERVFGVRRRSALYLMSRLGSYQVGRTALVPTADVIGLVEAVGSSEEFRYGKRRRVRLWEKLDAIRRDQAARQVVIAEPKPMPAGTLLPEGVRVASSTLQISFRSAEELLSRLYALSQSIATNYEAFQFLVERNTS